MSRIKFRATSRSSQQVTSAAKILKFFFFSLIGSVVFVFSIFLRTSNAKLNKGPDRFLFYIYEDEEFYPDLCREFEGVPQNMPRSYYFDVMDFWRRDLSNHPWRTRDPEQAELFIVPFNVDDSHVVDRCGGTDHRSRMRLAIQTLTKSPYYRRKYGWDHFWPIGHHLLFPMIIVQEKLIPPDFKGIISNMTIGRYLDFNFVQGKGDLYGIKAGESVYMWRHYHDWRCTITTPIITSGMLWQEDDSFEVWKDRPILVHYRGRGSDCGGFKTHFSSANLRQRADALHSLIPKSTVSQNHSSSQELYYKEIKSSKFCLVFRCDDPQTSRFYDALAAGCIPVIISDGFHLVVAPFIRSINYASFSIAIPETVWMEDPVSAIRFAYYYEESEIRNLYENLLKERPKLLWRHPQTLVATYGLREIQRKCLTPPFMAHQGATLDSIIQHL